MTFLPEVFPKIASYRREADPLHLTRSVICMEKIDGSNTRIGVPLRGRDERDIAVGGRQLLEGDPSFCQPELRAAFVDDPARAPAALELAREHGRDLTLYGETCGRGIQAQGFVYGPRVHLVLFAARLGGAWLSHAHGTEITSDEGERKQFPSLQEIARRLSLPLAPRLYSGPPDPARFDELLDRPSAHGASRHPGSRDATHEGIVIWSDPLLLDGAGAPLVAKHKHPRRREADERQGTADESLADFAARVVQPERMEHASQHLREGGRWREGPEGAELVIRRVIQDVAREEPDYQEQLARHGKARVREALEAAARERLRGRLE